MEKTNLENLNRLAKLFGTDRLISPEDIQEIRSILIGVLANNKKEVESLTEETKQAINSLLNKVLTEHDTYLEKTKQMAQEVKSDTTEAIKSTMDSLEEVKRLCKEVMESKPVDGKDADEEKIVSEVLAQIKLPEYKEVMLDDGGQIVDKINSLPVNEENQIDAKHIKNLPEGKGGSISGGMTKTRVQQMIDASGASSPLTTKGDVYTYSTVGARLGVGTNGQVLTADSAETTGLKWSTVSGTGDVVGPASSTDNAIVRFDGTTGKLVQNSAATIADISGNITAGTYNGNTIGAGSTSGTNTGDQTITLTGGVTGSGTGSFAATVVTNANLTGVVTSVGNATAIADAALSIAKTSGLQTALDAKQATITFGTGVQTALGVNVGSAGAPVLFNGALGTPSSGTLTNATGLPVAGITSSTTQALGLGSVELGHATDTTLSRSSAGVMAVEGVVIPSISSTSTITNKRNQPRIVSAASYTTDTGTSLDFSTCDIFIVTAQAGALKFNNPSGTPVHGEKIIIRVKDNGTARALTYDTQYRAIGVTLPTTTVISKTTYLGGIWNATDTKLDIIAVAQEA